MCRWCQLSFRNHAIFLADPTHGFISLALMHDILYGLYVVPCAAVGITYWIHETCILFKSIFVQQGVTPSIRDTDYVRSLGVRKPFLLRGREHNDCTAAASYCSLYGGLCRGMMDGY